MNWPLHVGTAKTGVRLLLVAMGAAVLVGHSPVGACDTPVYRYAMYRWLPSPYEIFFFHDAPPSEEVKKVHRSINDVIDEQAVQTNMALNPVNLSEEGILDRLPPQVKQAWFDRQDKAIPAHLVFTPRGTVMFSGLVDTAAFHALIDSPARKEIAELLAGDHTGVLLFLPGSDEKANQKAEKAVGEFQNGLRDGSIKLRPNADPALLGDDPTAEKEPEYNVGVVKVSRGDPKERLLVESLLEIEPDLREFDKPMVFVVYGRGRALEPYIGDGITVDNLAAVVEFICGACSCTVKDQNPGMDLLTRHDWETTAETMAERFGSEEGNESHLADYLFPEVIPASQPAAADTPLTQGQASSGDQVASKTALSEGDTGGAARSDQLEADPLDAKAQVASAGTSVALPESRPAAEAGGSTSRLMVAMCVGIGIGLFVLLGVTLFMFRPH